jgi:predicted RecB family nuclease
MRFHQGNYVEQVAMDQIGPGQRMPADKDLACERTSQILNNDTDQLIIQPAFNVDGVVIRPDAITCQGNELKEIKSAKSLKETYVLDLVISKAAAEHNGVPIDSSTLMHVNPEHRCGDENPKMVEIDLTNQVDKLSETYDIVDEIAMLRQPEPPAPVLSRDCRKCPYLSECFEESNDLVINIPRLTERKLSPFLDNELMYMADLELDEVLFETLTAKQQEFVLAHLEPVAEFETPPCVNREALRTHAWLDSPVHHHLDFETANPAIPLRVGESPYSHSVTQFSVSTDDGIQLSETSFITDGSDDREALIEALLAALEGNGPIVVYSESFEKGRIRELAQFFPQHANALNSLLERIVDLRPVVRDAVSGLQGESLKVVAPFADPTFNYDDLVISKGDIANAVMTLLLIPGGESILHSHTGLTPKQARDELLRYCARDTLGTAVIVRYFKRLLNAQH